MLGYDDLVSSAKDKFWDQKTSQMGPETVNYPEFASSNGTKVYFP